MAAAAIAHELSKPSIKDWIGPSTQVSVRKLNATRDWRNHLPSLGVKLEGGLLKDEDGNHLFLAMRRRGDIWVLYKSPSNMHLMGSRSKYLQSSVVKKTKQ